MPSFKMKSKSTTGCRNDKYGLHVSKKSCMISKCPLSSQSTDQNSICNQSNQDDVNVSSHTAPVCDEVHTEDLGRDEVNHQELSHESALIDPATDSTELKLSMCNTNMETMFSPILDSMDGYDNGDNLYVPKLDSEESDDGSRISCEYEACNVNDFYISDMIFSGGPTGSYSEFDNKTDTVFLPDYKFEGSSLPCDSTEEYVMLPFLEDTMDAANDFDGRQKGETVIEADNSSLYSVIHQVRSCNQEAHMDTYADQEYDCFDPQMYIRSLPDQSEVPLNLLQTSSANEKQTNKKITLVLDLDETLVHSMLDHCDDADFTFSVFFDMKEHTVYVRQRPHLQFFLKRVAEMFEVVVFTASQSIYAEQLLDILDPDRNIISRRAYRESCVFSDGIYTKDLTVLGVDLAKIAIIDNSPQVFRLQVNNGIPIKSWFDDPSDCALISLLPFLESLVDADDVRPIIAKKFGNEE